MAAKSPVIDQTSGLASAVIKIDGEELSGEFLVNYVNVRKQVNRVTTIEVAIYDGDPATQEFTFAKEKKSKVKPGKDIEVLAGYEEDGNKTIFKGIITGLSIKVQDDYRSKLIISGADKSILLCERRISKDWKEIKDSAVVDQILNDYSGIQKDVSATQFTHKKLVQYNSTDWDFILSRAEVNERVVITDENKLRFIKPGQNTSPKWKMNFGEDFYAMNLKVDGFSQYKKVKCKSWDPDQQQMVEQMSTEPTLPDIGDLSGSDLASALSKKDYEMHTSGQMPSQEVGNWAKSSLLKSRLSRIKGTILFQGVNDIKLDDVVEIGKTEGLFDGKAYVSGINHKLEASNFTTEITVGLENKWFIEDSPAVTQAHSASLLPGIKGLMVATVVAVKEDPDGEFRVKVKIPFIDESDIWARLAKIYASNKYGALFYPEVGDEVIVGFLSGDPRFPIILGSLYSKSNEPPELANIPQSSSENKQYSNYSQFDDAAEKMQTIMTKNKLRLSFLDDKKAIVIETPGGRHIFLDDDAKVIFIEDADKNYCRIDKDGFYFKSPNHFKVEVDGDIEMTAKGKIKTKSTRDTTMEAMNMKKTSQMKYEVSAGSNATVKATGMANFEGMNTTVKGMNTTVKGDAMVTISGGMVSIN